MYEDSNSIKEQQSLNDTEPFLNNSSKAKKQYESGPDTDKHFFCNICLTVPKLKFKSYEIIDYQCECGEVINQSINDLILTKIFQDLKIVNDEEEKSNKSISEEKNKNNENEKNYLNCKTHNQIFSDYCYDCEENICRQCLTNAKEHTIHPLFIFDLYSYNLNELIKKIRKDLDNEEQEKRDLKTLISIIMNDYINHPNYSHFETIESCHKILNNGNKNNNFGEKQRYYYIKDLAQLIMNKNNSNYFKKITITNSDKIINEIYNLNLENLVELNLKGNKINNIELLSKIILKKLKVLNLAVNEIDNSNIKYFFNLNSPKLAKLNIYQNKITDAEIFKLKNNPNNLPKLELFYIGKNNIVFNQEKINIEETKFNFNFIYMLGFSSNVFNHETIKFIQCFTMPKIEILYLGNNNLINLDFIEKLTLPYLKEFHLEDNQISDFERLTKFKNLEVINMENNKIQNIENLLEFIEELKYLKEFNLLKNKFINPLISKGILEVIKEKNIVLYDPITEY